MYIGIHDHVMLLTNHDHGGVVYSPPELYVCANFFGALLLYNNAQHIFLFINKVSLFHFNNKIVHNC